MGRLNADKLHVTYLSGTNSDKLVLPRRYTLTHSDITGELFLSMGNQYNTKQIARLYTKLMRDEVLAETISNGDSLELRVYCHISGGFVIGTAGWRYDIFNSELPLVLEAIRYGDKTLFEQNPELDHIPINVHFQSTNPKFNKIEHWNVIADYVSQGQWLA
jgi:hypothetical protein